jgi:phosphoribosylcarboxyaminoimidazole (NCAIR) mutase
MPIPVATVAIGNAKNAGLLAIRMLANHDAARESGIGLSESLRSIGDGETRKIEFFGI